MNRNMESLLAQIQMLRQTLRTMSNSHTPIISIEVTRDVHESIKYYATNDGILPKGNATVEGLPEIMTIYGIEIKKGDK